MLFTDYIVLVALAACVCLWWKRGFERRGKWLVVLSLAVILVATWSVLDDRWQAGFAIAPVALMLLGLLIGRKRARKGIPWISGTLLSLLAGLAFLAIYFFPVMDLPAPSGEFAVGVRDFELQDASRPGLMAPSPQDPRRLLVRVWYPANLTDGLQRRPYFIKPEVDTTGTSMGRFFQAPFAFKYLKHVMTNSYMDAPLAAAPTPLPVVIYSHGYTSFPGQNTGLMEHLASHGYVVYSIGHTYDSAPVVFPNGDVLDPDPKLAEEMKALSVPSAATLQSFVGETFADRYAGKQEAYREAIATNQRLVARSARTWTDDRIFVHDRLQAGAVPDPVREIVAAGDFTNTGQIGMSFGGSTTGEVCFVDSRCAAGVNLDGSDFHPSAFEHNSPVPFLMLYSDFNIIAAMITGDPDARGYGFNDFSYERPETAGLRPDVVRLKVNTVSHLGVSDFTWFVRSPLRDPVFGSIDSEDMLQIQNDFVLGFFDTYVRHRQAQFPQAQFAKHQAWVEQQDLAPLRQDWLNSHPEDQTIQVIIETTAGDIEVALYPERAPLTVANFLAYVDAGHYEGASFYRVTRIEGDTTMGVVQGGLAGKQIASLSLQEVGDTNSTLPPVAHEGTDQTGIPNEAGTLAMARLEPGTASSEFFFNVNDNPVLDTGNTSRYPEGHGYATFGRVLRGLPLLQQIQAMPSDAPAAIEFLQGQLLTQPITIRRVYRVNQTRP
jgi:predicted dienelactone hydrolase/cyclophilin family peptidyl-prolyl cis-trans isomerase